MRYKLIDDAKVIIILNTMHVIDSGSKYPLAGLYNGPKQIRQHSARVNMTGWVRHMP